MAYRSPTQPLCRHCGKPIAKRTDHFSVHKVDDPVMRLPGISRVTGPLYEAQQRAAEAIRSARNETP